MNAQVKEEGTNYPNITAQNTKIEFSQVFADGAFPACKA